MKIGKFAEKNNMNASTVRYYIDKALITPKRINGQYSFDDECMRQAEIILQYKQMGFSLEEMERLLYYANASHLKDEKAIVKIIEIIENRINETEIQIKNEKIALELLRGELEKYRTISQSKDKENERMMPVKALDLIRCPDCGESMHFENTEIRSSGIAVADISCECGYRCKIEDGIIICSGTMEESPFKAFENIDSVSAISDDFSPAYRNLMEKGHFWMFQQVSCYEENIECLMTGPFSYNFMPKYINRLNDRAIYIIVDTSLKRVKKLKAYFEGCDKNIVYVAGDIDAIPVKKGAVDCYIDDFSVNNYALTYNEGLVETVGKFLKPKGYIIGQLVDYKDARKSLDNYKRLHGSFQPSMIKVGKIFNDIKAAEMEVIDHCNHGQPSGNKKDFSWQDGEEKVSLITYCSRKK